MSLYDYFDLNKPVNQYSIEFVPFFFELNYGLPLREFHQLIGKQVPKSNPEFQFVPHEIDTVIGKRDTWALSYDGKIYDLQAPEYVLNYLFHLTIKEIGMPVKFRKMRDLIREIQSREHMPTKIKYDATD